MTVASWLETWTPDKVASADDPVVAFANYAEQIAGIPYPPLKDMVIVRKRVNELFAHYPQADYYTLCRLAEYARAKKRRVPRMFMVVDLFRDAWVAGFLPELDVDARDERVAHKVHQALEVEEDEWWRTRLLLATSNKARVTVLEEWERWRSAR